MEDLTLALITLTSFVLLFVVAIFADRAGLDATDDVATPATSAGAATREPIAVPVEDSPVLGTPVIGTSRADVA